MQVAMVIRFVVAENTGEYDPPTLVLICQNEESVVARYTGFELKSKCEGDMFLDNIKMTFCASNVCSKTRELIFTAPMSPDAKIIGYSISIGKDVYDSVVYPKCVGLKTYDETKAEETCAKAEVKQDMFKVSVKINEKTVAGESIVFLLRWHKVLLQNFHMKEGICYEYIFLSKSYFKCGETPDRATSNFMINQHGLADTSVEIDLSGCQYDVIDVPHYFTRKDSETKYSLDIEKKASDANIRFTFVDRTDRKEIYNAVMFKFDGYKVLGLTINSKLSSVLTAINSLREVIFVVDKSGSMEFLTDGIKPCDIVESALNHMLSACSDSNIYFNLLVFNDSSEKEDRLFPTSVKLVTSKVSHLKTDSNELTIRVKEAKDKIKERGMLSPHGGTNILLGLQNACSIPRIKDPHGNTVKRSIVLLTDGGDTNLNMISDLVKNEVLNNETRFFSIGIGNGVSFDIIEAVGNLGKGTHSYIWNLNYLEDRFAEIVKSTGIEPIKFKWDFNSQKSEWMPRIKDGCLLLDKNTERLNVPEYDSHQEIFPVSGTTMFCVFNHTTNPEEIRFTINQEEIKVNMGSISTLTGQNEEIMQRILGNMMTEILNSEIQKKISVSLGGPEKSSPIYLDWNKYGTSENSKRILEHLESSQIMNQYIEKVDFDVHHSLLTKDTLLMAGDKIQEGLNWKATHGIREMLCEQIVQNIKEDVRLSNHARSRSSHAIPLCYAVAVCGKKKKSYDSSTDSSADSSADSDEGSEGCFEPYTLSKKSYESVDTDARNVLVTVNSNSTQDFVFENTMNIVEDSDDFSVVCKKLKEFFGSYFSYYIEKFQSDVDELKDLKFDDFVKISKLKLKIFHHFIINPSKYYTLIILRTEDNALKAQEETFRIKNVVLEN